MSVLSRAQIVLFAAAVALALPSGTASAEQLTLKKFEKAMDDVFSGKIFEAAAKQVRQAHKKYATRAANNKSPWPFFIPDQSNKPVRLGPQPLNSNAAVQPPKAKPVVADPNVRRTQSALNTLGYDAGVPDGVYGRKTAQAVERYQSTIGETVTGALTSEQRTLLLNSAQNKRQIAAVQPKHQSTPSRAHTVVIKQSDTFVQPRPNTAAKQAQPTGVRTAKKAQAPVDDAKTTLPQSSDANPFDADDPDDALLPSQ